jgi:carbon-monoxide dehydrogenase large subunit
VTWVGQRLPRFEDPRLLTGRGRFTDDIDLPGLLHAAIVRSPVAHGELRGLDTTEVEGPVAAVLGPSELMAMTRGSLPIVWHMPGEFQHDRPLVSERVRFVGEPVGIAVAADRYAAEDAVDRILVEVDELPAVVDARAALEPSAPLLYAGRDDNVMCRFDVGDSAEHTDAVFDAAERTLSFRLDIGRVMGTPMEPRGIIAVPDHEGRLTVWTSTQAPHAVRDTIAEVTGMSQHRIRVVAPDVGGGFGLKDHLYEDELMVCLAAIHLGRPVKWIEDRYETLVATHQARGETVDVDVAFDLDGRLRGLRTRAVRNAGGYLSHFGGGPLFTLAGMLPESYTWDAVRTEATVVATNTTPTGAYRGFGQTQAVFICERSVDMVAGHLGIDPVEIRRRNMIRPEQQPYATRCVPITYDNGDYAAALDGASAIADSWPVPPDDGRRRGVGYASYVHMAGVGPSQGNPHVGLDVGSWESAIVRMEPDGTARLFVGTSPQGQGHATTFVQLAADRLGIEPGDIELVHSDTDRSPYSAYGTAASRSIAVGGGAVVEATSALAERLRKIAAELLEAAPADIVLAERRATVAGTNVSVTIADLARRAWQGWALPEGEEMPGLECRFAYDPKQYTFSYGTHVCRAAVDPDTGVIEIERYGVVLDCGTVVNPTIVEGQVHGGVAQGLGAALLEQIVVDDDAQPRSTTLLDYLLPVSASVPDIEVVLTETPSPFTPGGMKGMGEGGTNGSFACVVNAVAAALPEVAERLTATPLSPTVVWELLHPAP